MVELSGRLTWTKGTTDLNDNEIGTNFRLGFTNWEIFFTSTVKPILPTL